MQELIKRNYFLSAVIICGTLTAIKLLFLYFTTIPLWVDEAQYWGWSKELAAGYFSKPPLIAWLIHFTTQMFGDSEFGIRSSAPILHYFTALFIFLSAAKLYNKQIAFYSALIYITLPAVAVSSSFISTDVPLIFLWSAAFYFLVSFTKNPDKNLALIWLAYAVCLGLGLLSKYTMAAFVLMSFYYIFSIRSQRSIFKIDFWIANTIAFIIFVPNIYWNYNNQFISFVHTQENVVSGKAAGGLKFADMFEFLGGQIAVFGAAFILYLKMLFKKQTYSNKELVLFSLPLIVIGVAISLSSGAQAHWAAPAYVTASILVTEYIIRNNKRSWLKVIIVSNLIIFTLCLNIRIPASVASVKKDPLHRVTMWYKPTEEIKKIMSEYPDILLVSNERKIIATLMYALRRPDGTPETIYKWNPDNLMGDHYDLTRSFTDRSEKPIIFISRGDVSSKLTEVYFNVDRLESATEESPFYLFLAKGRR